MLLTTENNLALTPATAPTLTIKAIFNPGNRFVKMAIDDGGKTIVIPSGITYKDEEDSIFDPDKWLSISYVGRRPSNAIIAPWRLDAAGDRPYQLPGAGSGNGKALAALPLFLAAVWPRIPALCQSVSFELALLVHDPKGLAEMLQDAMLGTHRVSCDGRTVDIAISIKAIKREGTGLLMACGSGNAVIQDWGGDTLILQRISGGKIVTDSNAFPQSLCGWGSTGLVGFISSEGGKLPGLELGASPEVIFDWLSSAKVQPEIVDMIQRYLARVDRKIRRDCAGITQNCDRVMAIGGMLLIPNFKEALIQRYPGIGMPPKPQTADVVGFAKQWFKS